MGDASVRVAVRVRPFNSREVNMKSKLVIGMNGAQTTIKDPETGQVKTFTFDFSYWSHDGYKEESDGLLVATKPKYATQQIVFDDLGKDILDNAWKGFNCSLFAYGQTGSGKSFSMVGYGVNKGIIPITMEEIFKRIGGNDDPNVTFLVTVSMLEIYNEQIRDLLNPSANKSGGLKVREKPGIGVYVDGLTPVSVNSYEEVEQWMATGTKNRTVASTQMNATSSRAHTVVQIKLSKKTRDGEVESETTSVINLVDLAGSERAESTGATGDRLKEGANINKSLSALGNVISALADKSMGKKKVFVPYRNSVLTRLLQDALGGNSKTIMIAALSPADVNYDETLSTLRYADRAKKIKNKAVVNENPQDRMIRELKEENERLRKLIAQGGGDLSALSGGGDVEELKKQHEEEMRKAMEENQKLIENMKMSWEERIAQASEQTTALQQSQAGISDGSIDFSHLRAADETEQKCPFLLNLHEDDQLTRTVAYPLRKEELRLGRMSATEQPDIVLNGLNIRARHCTFFLTATGGATKVEVEPCGKARVYLNGIQLKSRAKLNHLDRLIFGANFMFLFVNASALGEGTTLKEFCHGAGDHMCDDTPWKQYETEESADESAETRGWTYDRALAEFNSNQGIGAGVNDSVMEHRLAQMEAAEAKKRAELEQKLREMEEKLKEERVRTQESLKNRRAEFERRIANGEQLSPAELAELQEQEDLLNEHLAAESNMKNEVERQRELTEQVLLDQKKRKREVRKLENQLRKLVPLVNEANTYCSELGRALKFEAKMTVKAPRTVCVEPTDELRHLKTIQVIVKVSSTLENDAQTWNWSTEKFENRLVLMRDVYHKVLDAGQPLTFEQADDPFYDPPEPVEIGRSYCYLKALSQLVEIENDFCIVNFKGQQQGNLRVEIWPEDGETGDELDYLHSPDEILGANVRFRLRILRAENLPEQFASLCFVTYEFNGKEYETESCERKSTSPAWTYEECFHLSSIDEENMKMLVSDAIVFQVFGFSDAAARQMEQSFNTPITMQIVDTEGENIAEAPLKSDVHAESTNVNLTTTPNSKPATSVPAVCGECEEDSVSVYCAQSTSSTKTLNSALIHWNRYRCMRRQLLQAKEQ
ncbi:MAG: hypothetical protein MHM6MM_004331 [Cercozoa sp. M6MM]